MQANTLLPATALIALVAAGPLSWAQDSHDTSAGPSAGGDAKAQSDAQSDTKSGPKSDAQNTPDNKTVAMAAGQPATVCNDRSNTVACGAKSIPHEPGVPPINPANQAPAPGTVTAVPIFNESVAR